MPEKAGTDFLALPGHRDDCARRLHPDSSKTPTRPR
jgi:hypothetical protein